MFAGEIVKKKKFWTFFLVQDRVQNTVQYKVGLRIFSPKIYFCKKPENFMFDGEIVKNNFL